MHLTSRRASHRARIRLLQPDAPTAPKSDRLPLLPSGPGGVHGLLLRRIRLSMPRDPHRAIRPLLCKGFNPAIADFGSSCKGIEAPLVPRLARLESSLWNWQGLSRVQNGTKLPKKTFLAWLEQLVGLDLEPGFARGKKLETRNRRAVV